MADDEADADEKKPFFGGVLAAIFRMGVRRLVMGAIFADPP